MTSKQHNDMNQDTTRKQVRDLLIDTFNQGRHAESGGLSDKIAWLDQAEEAIMRLTLETLYKEHKLVQHQAFNILKSATAVGQWSEIRMNQLQETTHNG